MPPAPAPPQSLGPFELDRLVGQGNYGCCYLYVDRATGVQRVVKSVASAIVISDPRREAAALERIQAHPHPNVVQFFGHEIVPGGSLLSFEYISGGELYDNVIETLSQGTPVPKVRARTLFHQIARGVDHLHKLGIGHLDIKLVRHRYERSNPCPQVHVAALPPESMRTPCRRTACSMPTCRL